jgi:hypothetical protein
MHARNSADFWPFPPPLSRTKRDTGKPKDTSTGLQDLRQSEGSSLWLSHAGVETHNALYATSIRATRKGEIHPIPERLCRGASLKEGELAALGYMGGQPAPGMLRLGGTRPEERAHRRVGMLPMRNGSRHEEASQDESANSCTYNMRHLAPVNARPGFAETKYDIVYHADCISLYVLYIKHVSPPVGFLQRPPCRLWYDGVAHAS